MDNTPCLDVDASGGDCSCDAAAPAGPLDTCVKEFVLEEGNIEPDVSPESNSMRSEQKTDLEKHSNEPRSTFPELELRDSCAEAPSPGNRQQNCALSDSSLSSEPVDMASDANESMSEGSPSSPASDIVEDDVSLEGNKSDHCFGSIPVDDRDRTVVISTDYVLYQDNYYTGASVIFSPSGIKIEGSTVSEHQGSFSFERGIDDIINIDCWWFQRVGNVTVNLKVLSEVAIGAENACGTSVVEELKLAVIEPRWSDKQEAITSLNFKYTAIWNIVLDPLIGMVGEDSVVHKSYFPHFHEPFEEVIYPKGDFDAVSISKRDVDLLQPETFINDTIIDFYIKYLKNQIQPEERQRFHFFNSFFFRKLADLDKDPSSISDGRAAFLRVRKWTRKLDMFGKDYIFIPVNFNLHWSLIVICNPGEVAGFEDEDLDKSFKVPCILHMDSIRGNHAGLKNLVQSYLWEEWKERHKETSEELSSKLLNLRFVSLELPQQENSFDCGLFLLHYLELFLAEAPSNFNPFKITKFSNFLNLGWFPPSEASLKRTLIQKLIFELLEICSREISSSSCSDEHHSSKSLEKIENENGVEFISESFSPEVACHGNLDSQAGQGIEMTLLASSSMRNMESVDDSGLVLREFFDPGVTTGSLLGQIQSFDQQPSYYNMNGAISLREQEDVQTGQQFVYLAPGENSFPQLTGITSQACEVPYSSRGFVMGSSWNPGISMQGEHEVDTSLETSHTSDDDGDDDDVGIIENNTIEDNLDPIEKQDADSKQPQLVENVELLKKVFTPASIEALETSIAEVPKAFEDADKFNISTEDADLPAKDNLPVLLLQNPGAGQEPELDEKNAEMAVTEEGRGDDVQLTGKLPSQDFSTASLHQNPSMVLNQLNWDSELVEKNSEMVANKEMRGDDVQMIGDDLPSQDNSTVLSHQNSGMVMTLLDQDPELVENKETRGDDVQMFSNGLLSEDNSTALLHQNPGMAVNRLDQDSEVVQNKEARGDDVQRIRDGLPSEDNSTASLHQNPGMAVNRLDQDSEVVENKEARGDDVQMIGDSLPSEDNSSASLHQNPGMAVNQLDQDSEVVENKEARGDDVQMIGDGLPSEDNSTASFHQNPDMAVNRLDQDAEVVENKEAKGDDVQMISDGLAAEDNSTASLHQNPGMALNRLDLDSEVVENKEARGDDVQMISDGLPSEDNSTASLHQNPGMAVNQVDQDAEVVENKEAKGDDVQMTSDGLPAEDNSTASLHQNPSMALNRLDLDSKVVENKEARGDDVQMIGDGFPSDSTASLHQNPGMAVNQLDLDSKVVENKEARGDDVQMIGDGLLSEDNSTASLDQNPSMAVSQLDQDAEEVENKEAIGDVPSADTATEPAAKRIRLSPSIEEKVE